MAIFDFSMLDTRFATFDRAPVVISTGAHEESLDFARDRLRGVEKSAPQRKLFGKDSGSSQEIPRLRYAPLGMTARVMRYELLARQQK
jgi:hypothetical protein